MELLKKTCIFVIRNNTRSHFNNAHKILTTAQNKRFYSGSSSSDSDVPKPVKPINARVGFIGDGNMAKAIAKAIVKKKLIKYHQIHVSSPFFKSLESWEKVGANISIKNSDVVEAADIIYLAVKPNVLQDALKSITTISEKMNDKLFISIMAGCPLDLLEKMLSKFKGARVVRCMPNTPMMVGEGCTVYCAGKNVTPHDISVVDSMLTLSGVAEHVPESMIDAIGALSGSGPAFVYVMIEALSDGAVKMGLHREMATKFAAQTVLGAAKMVLETGLHTGVLKDQVCSAGGTTIAGIHALEQAGVRGAVMDAVETAAKKAIDMSKVKY